MVYKVFIICILISCIPTTLFAQNKRLTNPNKDVDKVFPLMAWDYVEDEVLLNDMHEAGVNMVAFVPPSLLDACHKYEIKAILFDDRVIGAFDAPFDSETANRILPDLIRKYNDHPALYGYHLKDEPGPDQFPELSKSVALVKELAPGKWPYIKFIAYPKLWRSL